VRLFLLTKEEPSREGAVVIFEESWKELVEEYSEARKLSTFCSEADVELHLAHKLLDKLPPQIVHIELPVPLEIERFSSELFSLGRIKKVKYYKPDIAIMDPIELNLHLIAELKFTPIYWSYVQPLLASKKFLGEEEIEAVKGDLGRSIDDLRRTRQEIPSQRDIEKTYFGLDKRGRTTNVEKLIGILNDFAMKEGQVVTGYLCVIDEYYPNIKDVLQKAIKKYNPPDQFKILAEHIPVYEDLKKILEEL